MNHPTLKPFKLIQLFATMLLGTFGYTISLILVLLGAAAIHLLGVEVPTWTVIIAFVIGMPAGAVLELKTMHRPG